MEYMQMKVEIKQNEFINYVFYQKDGKASRKGSDSQAISARTTELFKRHPILYSGIAATIIGLPFVYFGLRLAATQDIKNAGKDSITEAWLRQKTYALLDLILNKEAKKANLFFEKEFTEKTLESIKNEDFLKKINSINNEIFKDNIECDTGLIKTTDLIKTTEKNNLFEYLTRVKNIIKTNEEVKELQKHFLTLKNQVNNKVLMQKTENKSLEKNQVLINTNLKLKFETLLNEIKTAVNESQEEVNKKIEKEENSLAIEKKTETTEEGSKFAFNEYYDDIMKYNN